MCTDAYREALTRDLSSTASSAPASTPAPAPVPGQRHATEAGREGVAGSLASIPLDATAQIASALAPLAGLHPGTAQPKDIV